VPIDDDGIDVAALGRSGVEAVLVTPANQYPTGAVLSPARRSELVAWARRTDAWILEDDYDGELRYDRQPVGAVQGLDPDRVLYLGTASKSLAPGLRLGWAVVPTELRRPLAVVKHLRAGVSSIDQLALADLIERGEYDRHIRSARTLYRRRLERLVDVVDASAPWLAASSTRAGLHLPCRITDASLSESALVAEAAQRDIGLFGLGPHWVGESRNEGLVLGVGRVPEHGYGAALEQLGSFLADY
jgi:GntR family transcriptional regulator/MocR family aminotransferase